MKVSTKGRYAVRALLEMADHQSEKPLLLSYIASQQEIPERYLIQIFSSLRRAGIVNSFRGAKGGFQLAKHPDQITLADILEAAEGPIEILDCLQDQYDNCQRVERCLTRGIWDRVNKDLKDVFQKITLSEMLHLQKEQRQLTEGNYQI